MNRILTVTGNFMIATYINKSRLIRATHIITDALPCLITNLALILYLLTQN